MYNNRLMYLDWAKGVGIFFIMLGHLNSLENPIVTWGNSFKIVIFYIISGYLFSINYKDIELTYKEYILKKLKTLGIPYIFFSIISIILMAILDILKKRNVMINILINIYRVVSLKGISTLWFLPSLFIAEILYFLLYKASNNIKLKIVIFLTLVFICIACINKYLQILCYGNLIAQVILQQCIVFEKGIIALAFFSFSAKFTNKILQFPKYSLIFATIFNIALSQYNRGVDFNNLNLGTKPILFFICGILGSYGIIGMLRVAEETGYKLKYLLFLGFNSLFIMCTHLPLYVSTILCIVIKKIIPYSKVNLQYYLQLMLSIIILSLIEYFLLMIWNAVKDKLRGTKIYRIIKFT